jgi:hypothetical protein
MNDNIEGDSIPPSTPEADFKHKDAVIIATEKYVIVKEESLEKLYNKKSSYLFDMISIDSE